VVAVPVTAFPAVPPAFCTAVPSGGLTVPRFPPTLPLVEPI
jgi:hypothetical protein